ncbi:glycoside hydrolase family 65 protein [Candidatus Omnitrophota bacterium]
MKRSSKRPVNDQREKLTGWEVIYEHFDPTIEDLRETLCTLGNGYMGVRGAVLESSASKVHYPGTYIAGVYNTLATNVAGKKIFNEDMINCPNCLLLSFRANKVQWNKEEKIDILFYRQKLAIKKGILTRTKRIRDEEGHITLIEEKRIVHMKNPHLLAIRYTITPENYSGFVTIRSFLDGTVQNTGVPRYSELKSKHLKPVSRGSFSNRGVYLTMKTDTPGIKISEASVLKILREKKEYKASGRIIGDKNKIGCELRVPVIKGKCIHIEKTCSIFTSRDTRSGLPEEKAIRAVQKVPSFSHLEHSHEEAWHSLWQKCNITLNGDKFAETVLRFHAFHLLQSAGPHNTNIDAGLGARGLHGESYRGHVFWDELFVMPFMSTHLPKTAEALLLYRHKRLRQARSYARKNGYAGSMFPWQSGSSGKEETQEIHLNPMSGKWGPDFSRAQRHVSFAIAYNVWRHWVITHDRTFLRKYGAEMLLSIAKFAASLCFYDKTDGRYHTKGLMGPDEFHEKLPFSRKAGFKDNAYSNLLIVWTLLRAQDALASLSAKNKQSLQEKLGITKKELVKWTDISHKMNVIMNEEGIISQFDGYFGLEELDWKAYRKKYKNIHRLDRILKSEGKSPDDYKVSKQADVLMLFYLLPFEEIKSLFARLGYRFNKKILRDNYVYYEKRTTHGSTLSKVVHCYVSHLLGMRKVSRSWFMDVLEADIHDTQGGTTPEGIHAGVMGGSIDIAIRAFAGIHISQNYIKMEPRLPAKWKLMDFNLEVRGIKMHIKIKRHTVEIKTEGGKTKKGELVFEIKGKKKKISTEKKVTIKY